MLSATSGEGMDKWLSWLEAQTCIGIPGQICAIDGNSAKVEVCGIQREVDLTLVGSVDEQGRRDSASGFWSTWASP